MFFRSLWAPSVSWPKNVCHSSVSFWISSFLSQKKKMLWKLKASEGHVQQVAFNFKQVFWHFYNGYNPFLSLLYMINGSAPLLSNNEFGLYLNVRSRELLVVKIRSFSFKIWIVYEIEKGPSMGNVFSTKETFFRLTCLENRWNLDFRVGYPLSVWNRFF